MRKYGIRKAPVLVFTGDRTLDVGEIIVSQGPCPLKGERRNAGGAPRWTKQMRCRRKQGCLDASESELEGIIRGSVVIEEC